MVYEQTISLASVKDGSSGESSFLHIKYSNDGQTFTGNDGEVIGTWIGIYTDDQQEDSLDFSKYQWKKIVGEDAYTIILENENISFATDLNRKPLSQQSFDCEVTVLKGSTIVSDFQIGDIVSSDDEVYGSTSGHIITVTVYPISPISSDSGYLNVPIVVNDETINRRISWSISKQGNQGPQGNPGKDGKDGADGTNGKDGVGVTSSSVTYQVSTSGTNIPTGNWSETIPTVSAGQYLWSKTDINYSNGTFSTMYSVSRMGTDGQDGQDGQDGSPGETGNGISSITEYYLATSASSGVTTGTPGWSTTLPTITSTNKYLWKYEVIHYTKSGDATIAPLIIGVYGDQGLPGEDGQDGAPGKDGNGIVSITNYYLATSSISGITTGSSGWTTTIQTISSSKKYLWNYEEIKYTNGNTVKTNPVIIGAYGDKGDKGDDGVNITSVDVWYYLSTSSASLSGGSWSTTAPKWVNGKYMWSKTITTLDDGTTTESDPVCITGAKGSDGADGQDGVPGKGIVSITEEYYLSTSKTTPTGGSWTTTPPAWSKGKYIWTRSKIVYENPSSTAYTTPLCDSSWEAVNEVEEELVQVSSSVTNVTNRVDNLEKEIEMAVTQEDFEGTITGIQQDVDLANNGKDKWLVEIYPKSTLPSANQSLYTIDAVFGQNIQPTNTYELLDADLKTTLNYGDNYIGYAKTFVYFNSAYTWNTTFAFDNGATLYVNAKEVFKAASASSGTSISIPFVKGWNAVEVVWNETTGNDGFKFGSVLSQLSQCVLMNCYFSTITARDTIVGTKYAGITIDINSITQRVSATETALSSKADGTTVTSLSTKVSQIEQNVGNISLSVSQTQQQITDTKNELEGDISDAKEELQGLIDINADHISWLVKSGTSETNFTITDRMAELVANYINLNGLVTFEGISPDVIEKLANGNGLSAAMADSDVLTTASGEIIYTASNEILEVTGQQYLHIGNPTEGQTQGWFYFNGIKKTVNNFVVQLSRDAVPVGDGYIIYKLSTNTPFIAYYDKTGQKWKQINISTYAVSDFTFSYTDYAILCWYRKESSSKSLFQLLYPIKTYLDIQESTMVRNWASDAISETTTINGGLIQTHTILASALVAENIIGDNGWINLAEGTFNYGNGKLVWNGSTLTINSAGLIGGTIKSLNYVENQMGTIIELNNGEFKSYYTYYNSTVQNNVTSNTQIKQGQIELYSPDVSAMAINYVPMAHVLLTGYGLLTENENGDSYVNIYPYGITVGGTGTVSAYELNENGSPLRLKYASLQEFRNLSTSFTTERLKVNTSANFSGTFSVSTNINCSGEIISVSANAFRAIYGNYGFFIRNDGANVYFMCTNSGNPSGTWNNFRPLTINLSNGDVSTGEHLSVAAGLDVSGTFESKGYTVIGGAMEVASTAVFGGATTINAPLTVNASILCNGLTSNGKITANNTLEVRNAGVELYGNTPFIDFHYNNSSSDYTSRIIADTSSTLTVCVGGNYLFSFGTRAIRGYQNNAVNCGYPGYLWQRVYAANATISTSDENEKDILPSGIDERYENFFMKLKPILFRWRNFPNQEREEHDRIHCGLGAQTTLKMAKECGLDEMSVAAICRDDLDHPTVAGKMESWGMAYAELHGLEIHMIQKLYKRIEELETQIQSLQQSM